MDTEKLKQKILDLAIRGKLVPQDPNDESAEELIKRIQEEKAKLVKEGKIKASKEESVIFKGSDNCYYEKTTKRIIKVDENFEFPKSWISMKLGNIGDWGAGATPNRSNKSYYENGDVLWVKTGELNDGYIFDSIEKITTKALNECSLRNNNIGDVLIAMYGATIGKLGITAVPLTTNQACCACTPFSFINNEYLFYYLMAIKPLLISKSYGGAQPNISKEKITNCFINFPKIDEQILIVNKIKELFKKIETIGNEYNSIINLISATKRKVLEEIFGENSSYKSYYENEYFLGDLLPYEQPALYIVKSTNYDDKYDTPVLTPGKSFILGYTNEKEGVYHVNNSKVIIFDDFTTASRIIDFDFKVKSSAMKILKSSDETKFNIDYLFFLLQSLYVNNDTHKRYWISEFATKKVKVHTFEEQLKIVKNINEFYDILDSIL